MKAIQLYRIERWCYLKHIPVIPKLMRGLIYVLFHCYIPYTADLGKGTGLAYGGIGVVLHGKTVVGKNCSIGTQVTIGGNKNYHGAPKIGDNCYIATGAKIFGPISVGEGSVIGANSVVTRDVPPRSLVIGIPGNVVKENINVADYSTHMKSLDE